MSLLSEIRNELTRSRPAASIERWVDLLPLWTELVELAIASNSEAWSDVDLRTAQLVDEWRVRELELFHGELLTQIAHRWPNATGVELNGAALFAASSVLREQAGVAQSVVLDTHKDVPIPPPARHALLRKIGRDAAALFIVEARGTVFPPGEYCRQLALATPSGISAAGRVFLQLHGRDAVRWLMALELSRSHGALDEWRCSPDVADLLLSSPTARWYTADEDGTPWLTWETVRRLDMLGLLDEFQDSGGDLYGYNLTEVGREILTELRAADPPPLLTLARSLSADVTAEALRDFGPAGQRASAATVEQAVAQQARNLVHELRNKVVPLKSALERIERGIPADSRSPTTSAAIEMANNIIEELFRFASTTAELSSNLQAPDEWFALGSAVRDAAQSGRNGRLEAVLEFDAAIDELELYGPRPVMVMAIANLVRNAVQAVPDKAPHIRVTLDRVEGEFHIGVQDNGPGISGLARARMFDQGFSTRDGGTGQGLYLARTGVERDFGGRVLYQESELGGAAFVLSLDASRLRKNG